jgi:hypothetical protein
MFQVLAGCVTTVSSVHRERNDWFKCQMGTYRMFQVLAGRIPTVSNVSCDGHRMFQASARGVTTVSNVSWGRTDCSKIHLAGNFAKGRI